ncbi:MAG TPA: hypothetical protein VEP50_10280 [bacterium]|nr:hypothetical protein [bacterium]
MNVLRFTAIASFAASPLLFFACGGLQRSDETPSGGTAGSAGSADATSLTSPDTAEGPPGNVDATSLSSPDGATGSIVSDGALSLSSPGDAGGSDGGSIAEGGQELEGDTGIIPASGGSGFVTIEATEIAVPLYGPDIFDGTIIGANFQEGTAFDAGLTTLFTVDSGSGLCSVDTLPAVSVGNTANFVYAGTMNVSGGPEPIAIAYTVQDGGSGGSYYTPITSTQTVFPGETLTVTAAGGTVPAFSSQCSRSQCRYPGGA